MARSTKNARHISVDGVAYSWRAKGDDGCIALNIWPQTLPGPQLSAWFRYHETWLPTAPGIMHSAGDQIVITNRLVRRVILHAINHLAYDPAQKGKLLNIRDIEQNIRIDDAIRAGQ